MTARQDTAIIQASACARKHLYVLREVTILLPTGVSWEQTRYVPPATLTTVLRGNVLSVPRVQVVDR